MHVGKVGHARQRAGFSPRQVHSLHLSPASPSSRHRDITARAAPRRRRYTHPHDLSRHPC